MKNPLVLNKYLAIILLTVTLIGCRTIAVDYKTQHIATMTPVALGMIGLQDNELLSSQFGVTTIPALKQKIRVLAKPIDFCKGTYKKYSKATPDNKQQITYIDSLDNKPRFITLNIIDKLAIKEELYTEENLEVIGYLKSQKAARMVTSISIALSQETITNIEQSEALFLVNKKQKQYSLELVRNNQSFATIDFGEGTIFGYGLSRFCWGADKRNKIKLFDIVEENDGCPGNSYRDAARAEERSGNHFKL